MARLDPELVPNSLAWKWLQEGREEGREEGRKEGRKEGRNDGSQRVVLRLLRTRFGELPSSVIERISAGSTAEVEQWAERLLTAESLEDVFAD